MHARSLFIGGERIPALAGEAQTLHNPATGERIGTIPDCREDDVGRAVAAARKAADASDWPSLKPAERAGFVSALAAVVAGRGEDLARLVTTENGTPITRSMPAQGTRVPAIYSYFAELGARLEPEETRPASGTLVRRVPVGVAGLITPWNGPQSLLAFKLGAALVAGCTAVIKPAVETSLDALMLAECATEAGIPPGVLNVVTGGADAGQALVEHPGVDMIAFTGSAAVGRSIGAACGERLRPAVLELGGKSAALVLDDADLDHFRRQVISVCTPNTGQVCYSCTRILAPTSLYEEVVDAVVSAVREAPVGDPMDPAVVFGPVVSAGQRDRINAMIEAGKKEGASVAYGGSTAPGRTAGFFVDPTVFRDVHNRMSIAQQEIFGPVLSIIPYDSDEDAIRLANDTAYGLAGTVFGRDVARARRLARQFRTGTVGVNGYQVCLDAPFGGVKASGLGRELGPEGLAPYLQPQSIYGY